MEERIKELRNRLWLLAYLKDRGHKVDYDRFNTMRDELLELQEKCSVPRPHEWHTDWEMWDGNIDTIVLQSPALREYLANGGTIPHTQRKTVNNTPKTTKTIKSTPKQEKPVKNANIKPKKKGRLF